MTFKRLPSFPDRRIAPTVSDLLARHTARRRRRPPALSIRTKTAVDSRYAEPGTGFVEGRFDT
jgi:hypothetical protein